MKKHNACIFTEYGWVEIDHETQNVVNCVKLPLHDEILSSEFYKSKEGTFWPFTNKLTNYENKTEGIISYYKTEYIPNILRYPEFTPKQFKESLLFLCNVCIYCEENNYFLRSHLWNVTYLRGKPLLIDIRDFEKLRNQSWKPIFLSHFRDRLDNHCPIHASAFVQNYESIKEQLQRTSNLIDILNVITQIIPRETNAAQWSSYYKDRIDFLRNADNFNEDVYNKIRAFAGGSNDPTKSQSLFNYIEDIKPSSIIEIGCNSGLYTFGASMFCNAIGIDYDKKSIDEANSINSTLQTNTTFVCLDVLKPTVQYGQDGAYGSIYQRFKSEMLIAPAIIHHLYNVCKSTDKIIEIFSKFSTRYLLIEHIPDTINIEELYSSIKKYDINIIDEKPSSPYPRKWILCELS